MLAHREARIVGHDEQMPLAHHRQVRRSASHNLHHQPGGFQCRAVRVFQFASQFHREFEPLAGESGRIDHFLADQTPGFLADPADDEYPVLGLDFV
jgi:hypothetical protein